MIRVASEKDRSDLERIGARYAKETLLGELTEKQMEGLIDICLTCGIVLLAEKNNKIVGIIGGRIIDGFAMGKFFEEVLWYVEPESRGLGVLLYKKLVEICKKEQCMGISMWAYCNDSLESVDRFYKMSGFTEIERKYYKKF